MVGTRHPRPHGGRRRSFGAALPFFAALVGLWLLTSPALAAPDALEAARIAARDRNLHQDRYWHVLLHYRPSLFGLRSLVDDPAFFLAPDGKTDPAAELAATLRGLFAPPDPDDPEAHAACRFPLRAKWLTETLDIPPNARPDPGCAEWETAVEAIGPKSAALIFPTYHMNNPASMFGHTLLTILSEEGTQLTAHAVNYSARTEETNGLFFAVKGLLGMYPGYYSVMPYYQKIQQYSDISQRDIWEYPLDLTRTEIRRMLMHLWELREIWADYYFFDENCSYNLLFLLEAARPGLRLTDRFSVFALPVDTIKAVRDEGLLGDPAYRPSRATKIQHRLARLSETQRRAVLDLVEGGLGPETLGDRFPDPANQAAILDVTAAYLQYRYAKGELARPEYRTALLATLKARSRLGRPEAEPPPAPLPPRPDDIHGTSRFWTGLGVRDGDAFVEVGWRPAFSDLIDTDFAPGQGTEIEFLSSRFRWIPDANRFTLERLDLIDILSLSPRDAFFSPYSWKLSAGLDRRLGPADDRTTVFRLATGAGVTYEVAGLGLVYGLLDPRLLLGGGLPENHAIGMGAVAGVLREIRPGWKAHLSGGARYFPIGHDHAAMAASLNQNLAVTKNTAIHLGLSWERIDAADAAEAVVNWYWFF